MEDDFHIEEMEEESEDQATEGDVELAEPKKGMVFDSLDDAFDFYKKYARKKGFAITKRSSRTGQDENIVQYFTLACSRQGKAQYSSKNTLKPNPSIRMDSSSEAVIKPKQTCTQPYTGSKNRASPFEEERSKGRPSRTENESNEENRIDEQNWSKEESGIDEKN
uniref:FAR1 domain-containing protein n=1 Tax=Oryza glumipatula TaxID=40148 RepID=A0A0D9Y6F5_9ORYZ